MVGQAEWVAVMTDETIATTYTLEQITNAVRAALNPVKIYVYETDTFRAITQEDVDRMTKQLQQVGIANKALQVAVSLGTARDA